MSLGSLSNQIVLQFGSLQTMAAAITAAMAAATAAAMAAAVTLHAKSTPNQVQMQDFGLTFSWYRCPGRPGQF